MRTVAEIRTSIRETGIAPVSFLREIDDAIRNCPESVELWILRGDAIQLSEAFLSARRSGAQLSRGTASRTSFGAGGRGARSLSMDCPGERRRCRAVPSASDE